MPAKKGALLYLPEPLLPSARAAGVPAMGIPPEFRDAGEVALAVAGYVAAGLVKMSAAVGAKAQMLPFRGAFDFRGGDVTDDPLLRAAVLAIALGLEDTMTTRGAA
jgi:hypothetical protein